MAELQSPSQGTRIVVISLVLLALIPVPQGEWF